VQALKSYIQSISPVSPSCWDAVSACFTPTKLKKGEAFIAAGQSARKLGFLEKGIMRAYYRTPDGDTYNKHFFLQPCFVGGFASLITGEPNQIIQEALTSCELWVTDYLRFVKLYDQFPELERVARKLAETFFVQKEQREVDLVMLDAEKRYLKLQLTSPELEQLIPQYHIASYLGISATQLSRIRKKISSQ